MERGPEAALLAASFRRCRPRFAFSWLVRFRSRAWPSPALVRLRARRDAGRVLCCLGAGGVCPGGARVRLSRAAAEVALKDYVLENVSEFLTSAAGVNAATGGFWR